MLIVSKLCGFEGRTLLLFIFSAKAAPSRCNLISHSDKRMRALSRTYCTLKAGVTSYFGRGRRN